MRIISRRALREFWVRHPDAEQPLIVDFGITYTPVGAGSPSPIITECAGNYELYYKVWYANARHTDWKTPSDVKATYRNASIVENNRVVFNIKGNFYRLVTAIDYQYGIVYIRFVGTH